MTKKQESTEATQLAVSQASQDVTLPAGGPVGQAALPRAERAVAFKWK